MIVSSTEQAHAQSPWELTSDQVKLGSHRDQVNVEEWAEQRRRCEERKGRRAMALRWAMEMGNHVDETVRR